MISVIIRQRFITVFLEDGKININNEQEIEKHHLVIFNKQGSDITISTIEASKIVNLLDNINLNRIVVSNIKNVDYNDIPVETQDKAPIKYVVTEVADKIKLQIYYTMNKVAILKKECYYSKDTNGILTPLSY